MIATGRASSLLSAGSRSFLAVLLLALLLRLPTIFVEMFHHPDEIWQYLEPAYGIATGRWVTTWEWREGMRSWLIPTLLAPAIALGKAVDPAGPLYRILPRLLAILMSLSLVGFGMALGSRLSRIHALVAGLVLATSFELIYFSARTLSETFAVAMFMPAAWLLWPSGERTARRLAGGGLLLGLCVACRFQLAPTALVLAMGCCRMELRAWAPVMAGGLAGLALDGVVDAAHGLWPLRWMVENVRLNIFENRSAAYGVEPAGWFVVTWLRLWWIAALPLLVLIGFGARRQPLLLGVALTNLAVHSLVGHKEYRFILLTEVLLIYLAALGTADGIGWAARRMPQARAVALAGMFWLGCSAAVALSPAGRDIWSSNKRSIAMMRAAHDAPGSCGFALFRPDADRLVAYYYYDRPGPILYLDGPDAVSDLRRYRSAFDVVMTAPDNAAALGAAYGPPRCFGRKSINGRDADDTRCLFQRAGGCAAVFPARLGINAALVRRGD